MTKFERLKKELKKRNDEREMSPLEAWVIGFLERSHIYDYSREYQVDYYFIDIAFPRIKFGVELDGKQFHKDKEKDDRRDKYLQKQGWQILRISSGYCWNPKLLAPYIEIIFKKLYPERHIPFYLSELLDVEIEPRRLKEKEIVWCNKCQICHIEGNCENKERFGDSTVSILKRMVERI